MKKLLLFAFAFTLAFISINGQAFATSVNVKATLTTVSNVGGDTFTNQIVHEETTSILKSSNPAIFAKLTKIKGDEVTTTDPSKEEKVNGIERIEFVVSYYFDKETGLQATRNKKYYVYIDKIDKDELGEKQETKKLIYDTGICY